MWLIHHINGIKHALRVLPVIAAVAKVSCKHGLWLVARVNRICLKCIPTKPSEALKFLKVFLLSVENTFQAYFFDNSYFL